MYDTEISAATLSSITDKIFLLVTVASKDQKEFIKDLKPVYQAVNRELASLELEKISEKWNKKYSIVIDFRQRNWVKIRTILKYPQAIRKLFYTTNTIKGYYL